MLKRTNIVNVDAIQNKKIFIETLLERHIEPIYNEQDCIVSLNPTTNFELTVKESKRVLQKIGILCDENEDRLEFEMTEVTSRGLEEYEIKLLVHVIVDILSSPKKKEIKKMSSISIKELNERFPK